jgi:hypothetical protein
VVAVPILIVALLLATAGIQAFFSWPNAESMGWALLAVLVLALIPIARYIAVTDGQVYVGLLSRAQAVNSLLDGLLRP